MSEQQQDIYYHFAHCDHAGTPRLAYGDNREIKLGETLTVDLEPILCERGLHASRRIIDALGYARGSSIALCQVTLGGTVLHDDDKSVGTERTVVAMLTAEQTDELLRRFARRAALQAAHLWEMPEIVRQYLETGDESLRAAARAAAGAAARAAARDAAGAAARAAAGAAARAAAGAAARDAARAAAWAAAWAAAGAAARDAAWAAARAAAGAAARDAAGAAAWAAQEAELLRLFAEYAGEPVTA